MRISNHSKRVSSSRHNDRRFDLERASHIDSTLSPNNRYWSIYGQNSRTFREDEHRFYKERYGAWIDGQNERNIATRHPERCRTTSDVLENPKTCPEEVIFQIGNKDKHVEPKTLISALQEYLTFLNNWNQEHGNHMHILNVAIHLDEKTPHAHIRRVWDYENDRGEHQVGQDKALEQAGVPLRDSSQPRGRHNNRKQVFDSMCRDKLIEICKGFGLHIEEEPIPGQRHKDKEEFIDNQIKKKADRLESLSNDERKMVAKLLEQEEKRETLIRELADTENAIRLTHNMLRKTVAMSSAFNQALENVGWDDRFQIRVENQENIDTIERAGADAASLIPKVESMHDQVEDHKEHLSQTEWER